MLPSILAALAGLMVLTGCGPPGTRALHKGDSLVQNGQFEEAIEPLKEATQVFAHSPAIAARAWNLLGVANQGAGHPGSAYQAYLQALKLDRNLAVADYNEGCLLIEQSNYPAAIVPLTTFITLRARDPDGYLRLGDAYFHLALQYPTRERLRQMDNARIAYEDAEKFGPSAESANDLGMLELARRAGNPSPDAVKYAVRAFQTALGRSSNYPPALLNLAIVDHQYLGDPTGALDRYRQYMALQPPPANTGDVEKIARELEVEARIQIVPHAAPRPAPQAAAPTPPTNAGAPARRAAYTAPPTEPEPQPIYRPAPERAGSVMTQRQSNPPPVEYAAARPAPPPEETPAPAPPVTVANTTEANPAAESTAPRPAATEPTANLEPGAPQPGLAPAPKKSILDKLNPRNWFGGRKPTPANAGSGEEVSGNDRYNYPLPVTPIPGDRATAQHLVEDGVVLQHEGHLEDAIGVFQRAMDTDSTYFQAPLSLGLASIDARDYATALTSLDRALKLRDDSADARYAFAWVLQKKGYYQDAALELEKLLSQHPDQTRAHLLLGNLYAQKLGQPRLARDHYLRVLELDPQNSQAQTIRNWLSLAR